MAVPWDLLTRSSLGKINAHSSQILVHSGTSLLYAPDRALGSANTTIFSCSKAKAVQVSGSIVNKVQRKGRKCPDQTEIYIKQTIIL